VFGMGTGVSPPLSPPETGRVCLPWWGADTFKTADRMVREAIQGTGAWLESLRMSAKVIKPSAD
jgi:hypothetical protein